ncbi:hypothetical protein [Streptomyces sp. NPDC000133]|uniref:hypothetical protein n=1 Tax=Streptomyces sp. NPDC000133 TaxID=3364535 RepID=UPI00367A7DE3
MNIWLDWWPETFEHVRGKIQGTSAAYDLTSGEPRLARMFVDCQRPDLVEPGKEMDLLRVVIDDRLQLSSKSRVRLLNAAASQVIEFMDCKNKVTLPAVDAVVQVDPRLK